MHQFSEDVLIVSDCFFKAFQSSIALLLVAALLIVPLVLFPLAAARYALLDTNMGDLLSDLAFLFGGAILTAISYYLYRLLMGRRR